MAKVDVLPLVQAFLERPHGHFIAGKAHPSRPGAVRLDVVNPATEQVIAHVGSADKELVQLAVESAHQAFLGPWQQCTPADRQRILLRLADLLEANREQIAQLETLTSGKLIGYSRLFEVDHACAFIRYYAGWATKISGETLMPSMPSRAGESYKAFTQRMPLGVVAAIVPWNFPVMIAIWKIAAALTTGCCVVVKPSEFTPVTLLRVAELAIEAGLPEGVFNVVNGEGSVGQWLIEHPLVRKVSFTGSVPTGIKVGQAAIGADLTRFTLELGGKNPAAFLADVDVQQAVEGIMLAGLVHQGQVCASAERFYVHESRYDALMECLIGKVEAMRIGDPMEEGSEYGPMSNKAHWERLKRLFSDAQRNDQLLSGGKVLDGPGFYVSPAIIRAKGIDDPLMREEAFAGVLGFQTFSDEQELLHLMNSTRYGLAASIWTNDFSKAMRFADQIEAGQVWINMHTMLDPSVPFGGSKASGIGREFGSAFIADYTELKSVIMRY